MTTYSSAVIREPTVLFCLAVINFNCFICIQFIQNYTCFSWLPICWTTNLKLSTKSHKTCSLFLLVQIQTQNLPLYCNSLITGRLVNSPRLWFDVILDFVRVTNVYITLHYEVMALKCEETILNNFAEWMCYSYDQNALQLFIQFIIVRKRY